MKLIKENDNSFIFLGGIDENLPITQMNRIELSNLRSQIDSYLEQSENIEYAKCKELLKECFDVIGTSKLCTKPIYEKLLQHFA